MKNSIFSATVIAFVLGISSCSESEFTERYPDPAKIAQTTVEKQYTGFLASNKDYVLPKYRNYFVSLRSNVHPFIQATGMPNSSGQYIPGSSGIEDVWYNYYNSLAQYRELQKIYAALPEEQQTDRKVFLLTATVYLYDYTQRVIDLHGDIPFTEAGMLSTKGGDYGGAIAKFDDAQTLYVMMLDELKTIASELNNLTLNAGYQQSFSTQDFVNKGNLSKWKRYCNSLRIRMLNRVSDVESLKARVAAEMAEIFDNPATTPVVETNEQNIQIDIFNVNTEINIDDFQGSLESGLSWYINTAGKKMIDHMNANADPRRSLLFEPGENANGQYVGIDPMATNSAQTAQANAGLVATYHRYTLSRNKFLPGVLISASQMNLIKAEFYLRSGNLQTAKTAYETAIRQSVEFYNSLLALSNASGIPAPTPATSAQITAYLGQDNVSWDKATTPRERLERIATQKWLHYSIIQSYESWADVRRLDLPVLQFWTDNASEQTQPPVRWVYPSNEITYNAKNYSAVRDKDKLTTRLFWDIN
jgi:hypothetical protein